MAGLRIAYAGTPEFAVPALQTLATSSHDLVVVLTQPDQPAGRGRKLRASPVKQAAKKFGVEIMQPANVNSNKCLTALGDYAIDLLVVAAYGQLFSRPLLTLPKFGCVNIHASLLPRWRGASPIQHAILHGDDETGISIMQMAEGMDAGDIWLQSVCPIQAHDTAQDLHDRLANLASNIVLEAINLIINQSYSACPQNADMATYCSKLRKVDGQINWQEPAATIARKVRAFHPWPGAYTDWQGRRLRITRAVEESIKVTDTVPGTVLAADKNGILVATGNNGLRLQELIPAGGKCVAAADFINANHIAAAVLGQAP